MKRSGKIGELPLLLALLKKKKPLERALFFSVVNLRTVGCAQRLFAVCRQVIHHALALMQGCFNKTTALIGSSAF